MLNQNQTELSSIAIAHQGILTNKSLGDELNDETIGAEGIEIQISEAEVSITPVQKEQNGASDALAEENLYECHHLTGGAAHPGIIVETAGLANIKPPRPEYRPRLPVELVKSGKISEIQLERIIYAGQAHAQTLPESNARAGISIGDGTGVGKTGTILGIILDNWFSGRKRTVWFSVKFDLIKAVKDEMTRLGFRVPIQLINDYKPEAGKDFP